MRNRNRQEAALHTLKEQRGRALDAYGDESAFELLAPVAHEMRPVRGTGNQGAQIAHHLAPVAYAQRERIAALEERSELVARACIVENRLGPALPASEHVAIGKAAGRNEPGEIAQRRIARDDVAGVDIHRFEPG